MASGHHLNVVTEGNTCLKRVRLFSKGICHENTMNKEEALSKAGNQDKMSMGNVFMNDISVSRGTKDVAVN